MFNQQVIVGPALWTSPPHRCYPTHTGRGTESSANANSWQQGQSESPAASPLSALELSWAEQNAPRSAPSAVLASSVAVRSGPRTYPRRPATPDERGCGGTGAVLRPSTLIFGVRNVSFRGPSDCPDAGGMDRAVTRSVSWRIPPPTPLIWRGSRTANAVDRITDGTATGPTTTGYKPVPWRVTGSNPVR